MPLRYDISENVYLFIIYLGRPICYNTPWSLPCVGGCRHSYCIAALLQLEDLVFWWPFFFVGECSSRSTAPLVARAVCIGCFCCNSSIFLCSPPFGDNAAGLEALPPLYGFFAIACFLPEPGSDISAEFAKLSQVFIFRNLPLHIQTFVSAWPATTGKAGLQASELKVTQTPFHSRPPSRLYNNPAELASNTKLNLGTLLTPSESQIPNYP